MAGTAHEIPRSNNGWNYTSGVKRVEDKDANFLHSVMSFLQASHWTKEDSLALEKLCAAFKKLSSSIHNIAGCYLLCSRF